MAKEFIVYSKTKAEFEALVLSGEVDTSQMGIIAETGEMWWNGEYRPLAETVPFANDLTGRIEATPEEFTFRPSAGDKSIRDESALIKRIKGNTIVWKQLHYGGWPTISKGTKVANSDGSITFTATSTSVASIDNAFKYTVGHKYLMSISAKLDATDTNASIYTYGYTPVSTKRITSTQYSNISVIKEAISDTYHLMRVGIASGQEGASVTFKNWQCFDLTQMFGAGNEPTTVEEFKALFPNDYYDYNAGELVSMTSNGLFANGFNQWDEQWEVGSISITNGTNLPSNIRIRSKNYNLAIPNAMYYFRVSGLEYRLILWYDAEYNFIKYSYYGGISTVTASPPNAMYFKILLYDSYGTTYKNDICINLSHTGVRNGEYEPYWDVTKDLSIIQKYFPNGMRSAGSIYDEISFDESTQKWVAIQRVGERGFTDGDSEDTSVITDGTNTHYALAEPIITTIEEPIDLSYKVGDFGIEKILSDSFSAPFKADIIYQFNATDRVRENSMNISKLSKKQILLENEVDALESKALTTEEQNFSNDQKAQVATNLGGNTDNGLVRYVGGVLPLKKISAPDTNGVEQNYVLPNASDEDKESANGVIATEGFVDDGYVPRPSGTSASKANKLLAYSDGRTYDSGVGIAQDVSDITNSATDSVPTSAIVKEYVNSQQPTEGDGISIRGKSISVKSTNAFSFKDGQLDLSANTINSIQKGEDAKDAIDALSAVISPSISGGVRVLDITVTSGLIDDNNLVYALPSAPEESLGDADAVLATEGYVANYMNDNLPTAVATATERVLTWPATNSIRANTIYDISQSTTTALTIYSFVGGSGTTYAFDDVWRVRFAGVSSALSVVPTVRWENGIAPNFSEWAICDLEFRRLPNGEYIGKWKIYR